MTCRGVTMEYGSGFGGDCHGTTRGMLWHPTRRAKKSSATPRDAVGISWYAMGGTMAMPRRFRIV